MKSHLVSIALTTAIKVRKRLLSLFQAYLITQIISRCLILHPLPNITGPLRSSYIQGSSLNGRQGLFELRDFARSNDNPIPIYLPQPTMIRNPSISERRFADPSSCGNFSPPIQRLVHGLLAIQLAIDVSEESLLAKAAFDFLRFQRGGIFDKKAAGDGGVCVETYFELAKQREEVVFGVAGHCIVIALESCWED